MDCAEGYNYVVGGAGKRGENSACELGVFHDRSIQKHDILDTFEIFGRTIFVTNDKGRVN